MFDDLDYERLVILRWLDPDEDGVFDNPYVFEGTLWAALAVFARLARDQRAHATITLAPQPGDWSATVLDARELRRMAKARRMAPVRRLFSAVGRRRRTTVERYPVRPELWQSDLRFRPAG